MVVILNFTFFIERVILIAFRPIADKLLDVFCWIFYGGTKPLPAIDNKLLLMPATQLAKKIRKREVSALEVMQTYIKRLKAVQPVVNGYVDERFEEAIADAKAVDKLLDAGFKTEEEIAEKMPLLGVPFTCKEIIGVKDLAQTWGIKQFKNRKAPEDSYCSAQLKKAGAIPVAVTNIPTMSVWWDTSNPVFGITKNPFNNNRAVGGSSGGEGALISTAASVIGIGSDLAGSIRIPASFCGIYGHKPTPGIVSNKTRWPEMPNTAHVISNLDRYLVCGPMCRYPEDLNVLVRVLSGENRNKLRLNEKVDFRNVRVYYIEEFPGYLLSATSDVKAAVRKAVNYFEEEYGVTASRVQIEELKHSFDIWESKLFEAGGSFRSVKPESYGRVAEFWEFTKWVFGYHEFDFRSMYHASIEFERKDKLYEKCINMYNIIEKKLGEVLDGNAILILPSHPEPPPHSIVTIPKFKNIAYTCIFSVLGLPVTAVPAGQSEGLPIGLQVVARKNNDHLTLAAGVELKKLFGGWISPSPISV